MNLNINTVDLHLNKGRLKLGARTTHEALAKAVLAGLIEP
jgi:DNA-binding CsgD family transcriptional regulator